MTWNIPEKQIVEMVTPPKFGRLAIAFSLVMALIIILGMAIYHISRDERIFFYLLVASVASVIFFTLSTGWFLFQYGLRLEKNEMIKVSNANLEYFYSNWALEYVSIVAYNYIFPDEAQISNLKSRSEINVIGQKTLKFPADVDYASLFYEVISPLRYLLIQLANNNALEIVFPMRSSGDQSTWSYFKLAWRRLGLNEETLKKPVWMVNDYVTQIDQWLTQNDERFRLVVICEPLVSLAENDKEQASDGISVWLCAPSAVAKNYQIEEKAKIYRAVYTNTETLNEDLARVMIYQSKSGNIDNVWFSKFNDQDTLGEITRICAEHNNGVKFRHNFSHFILGRQGVYDILQAVTLSLLSAHDEDSVNLIVSQDVFGISLSRVKIHRQNHA